MTPLAKAAALMAIDEAISMLGEHPSCSTLTVAAGSRFMGPRLEAFLYAYRQHSLAFQKGNGFADVKNWESLTKHEQCQIRRMKLLSFREAIEYGWVWI